MSDAISSLACFPSFQTDAGNLFTVSPIADPVVVPICPEEPRTTTARVIHVINGEHYSGAERVQDGLALVLPQYGFDVQFVCLKPGRFAKCRRAQGAPVENLPMRSRWDVAVASQIAALAEKTSAVLLHAHTPRSAMITALAARKCRLPWLYHAHSPTLRDSGNWVKNFAVAMMEWWAVRQADHIIAVADSLKRYWQRWGISADRVSVVHNGVPSWPTLPKRPHPGGTWTIGTVALFRPRKGIEILLRSLHQLRREKIPVRLLAVGPFETRKYEYHVKSLAARLGLEDVVSWVGFTPHVDTLLAKMDLFVLPSLFGEGLPMVILEAMALGVPVVASRVEGVPEVIRDGQDGLCVTPGSVLALTHALRTVISGQVSWQSLREQAYRRQRQCFSLESMGRATADVYRHILRHWTTRS
ncbi:MAG: glycosyltransferase family 4 protein [Thermogutta sp.]|nr:glycosyltransferase family 4 protein [Thermogutta sp.]HOP77216.1 glycosyltransferase family 4 protein [Thermogutta sp.]HPU06035.1 glycosyltransferase family 4 protein [Thermogutta sp.]HQF12577.1 glycosyltransferase family 4 protein [Thermogutta sp.]